MKPENKVNKICENCAFWEEGECLKLGSKTKNTDTCKKYSPEPTKYCSICNSKATNDDTCSAIFCNENDHHYASHWDYQWFSID